MKYQLKDEKTGSYSQENINKELCSFLVLEKLKMYDYTILSSLEELRKKALINQFRYLLETTSNYYLKYDEETKTVFNNHITLRCSISVFDYSIDIRCSNILEVKNRNTDNYLIDIDYIKSIQNEINSIEKFINDTICNKLEAILSKED